MIRAVRESGSYPKPTATTCGVPSGRMVVSEARWYSARNARTVAGRSSGSKAIAPSWRSRRARRHFGAGTRSRAAVTVVTGEMVGSVLDRLLVGCAHDVWGVWRDGARRRQVLCVVRPGVARAGRRASRGDRGVRGPRGLHVAVGASRSGTGEEP